MTGNRTYMNWPLFDTGVALALVALAAPWIVRFNFWLYRRTGLIRSTPGWETQAGRLSNAIRFGCGAAGAVFMVLGSGLF